MKNEIQYIAEELEVTIQNFLELTVQNFHDFTKIESDLITF